MFALGESFLLELVCSTAPRQEQPDDDRDEQHDDHRAEHGVEGIDGIVDRTRIAEIGPSGAEEAKIDTSTAVPNAAATWRVTELSPDACPTKPALTAFIAVTFGDIDPMPAPKPPHRRASEIHARLVSGVRWASPSRTRP